MSLWRRRLAAHAGLETGLALASLRDQVSWSAGVAHDLAELAETANDPAVSPRQRMLALMTVALVAGERNLPVPEDAVAATESPEVVDEAIAGGLIAALTGILGQVSGDPSLHPTRRLIARRLLSLGERGPHITAMLITAGDHTAAVRAAADDFVRSVQPVAVDADAVALAWAGIFLGWYRSHPDTVFVPLCHQLRARGSGAPEAVLALLGRLPQVQPAMLAIARGLLTGEDLN